MHLTTSRRKPAASLLATGLDHFHTTDELWRYWQALSPREHDVAALTCLGYTNRQIAARLRVAPDTVKGYIRQVLVKFHDVDRCRHVGDVHHVIGVCAEIFAQRGAGFSHQTGQPPSDEFRRL